MARIQIIRTGGLHDHVELVPPPPEPERPLRAGDLRRRKARADELLEVEWLHKHGWHIDDEWEWLETC